MRESFLHASHGLHAVIELQKIAEVRKESLMGVREKYQEKVEVQLHEWREWIDHYKVEPNRSDPNNAVERQRMMERLEDCQQNAQIRLQELRSSQEEHWELAKQAVERAMIDLKRLMDESGAEHAGRSLLLQTSRAHIYEPYAKRG